VYTLIYIHIIMSTIYKILGKNLYYDLCRYRENDNKEYMVNRIINEIQSLILFLLLNISFIIF